jgi:type III restriction enzyme
LGLFFAYVLASLQNINSATDVEQLLGRVLRMPYAKLRQNDELNKAYAHVISSSIAQATMLLKDRMVQNMGFNKWEADTAIVVNPQPELDLGQTGSGGIKPNAPEVIISVPFEVKADTIPTELQPSVQKLDNSQGTSLVINKGTTDEEFDQIEQAIIDQATQKQKHKSKKPLMMLVLNDKLIKHQRTGMLHLH